MRLISRTALAVSTVAALAIGPTVSAIAANDPATVEQAGYQLTNAQFRFAHETVYLRTAGQYSGSVAGFGQSVQFWGGGRVYVLGVSDSTTASPYSPAVAIFDSSTHALVCSTAGATPCPDTPQSWLNGLSYPAQHTVTLSVFYSTTQGTITFTVRDETANSATAFTYDAGLGVSFKKVRLGTEFGSDPWTAPGTFTPPAAQQKVATFTDAGVANYKGNRFGITGYFTTAPLTMTGAGSVVQAEPGPIKSSGTSFDTLLVP